MGSGPAPLHHRVDGPQGAPTLVLGGSLGSTLEMWEPQMPAFSETLRVVRYDHRGHGGTPAPPGPYTIGDLGGDVLSLLDRLGIERAHVGGLSLGGMVAMWLAANAPERVDRVALLCTSARLGPASNWYERAALVRRAGTGAVADAVVGRWLTPSFAAQQPDLVARFRGMIAATDPEGYAGCCEAIAAMDQTSELARVTAPTMVIAGRDDPATPPDHAELIAAGVPDARLEIVAPAAHLASWEQAAEVNRLLLDHFASEMED